MTMLPEVITALTRQTHFGLFLDLAVKSTAVLAAAGLAALLVGKRSAAARHGVWALAVVGLLVLPALSFMLPSWHVAVPVASPSEPRTEPAAEPRTLTQPPAAAVVARTPSAVPYVPDSIAGPFALAARPNPERHAVEAPAGEPPPHSPEPSTSASAPSQTPWLLAAWLAGAAAAGLPLLAGLLSLWRLRRECRPLTSGPAAELVAELRKRLGLRRPVSLLLGERRAVPMTWGVARPVVLLPAESAGWSPDRLRTVLLHELAHVRRHDCLTQFLGCVVRALYWFNPLAWLAVRRLRIEQERACDDAVLNAGSSAADYAEHLLAVTTNLATHGFLAPVALAMGRAARVESRLRVILDPVRDRRPVRRASAAIAGLAALALLLPLATVSLQPRARAALPEACPVGDADQAADGAAQDQQGKLSRVREAVKKHSVRPVDEKALDEGAIRGMVGALHDPYAEYFDPAQLAEFTRQTQGNVTGIGAQLRTQDKQVVVLTPLDDSPALKAGLRAGDVILAVDGQPTQGRELTDVVKRIVGKPGTDVKLKVRRPDGKEEELTVTRAAVRLPSVIGVRRGKDNRWEYRLDPANQIGYLRILNFATNTAAEVKTAVEGLKNDGLKGFVLDLRFCPGGMLNTSVGVAELFLDKGTIVTVKGNDKSEHAYRSEGNKALGGFPVLVLVNDHTASAGEIVAAALQDNGRAVVLGTRSFGKGAVQQVVNLDGNAGAVKLTSAYLYRPSGRMIHKRPGEKQWGVDPDDGFYVPMTAAQEEELQKNMRQREVIRDRSDAETKALTDEEIARDLADPQLAAALRAMTAKVTKGEFEKVGKSNAAQNAALERREKIQQEREQLIKNLEKVNKELADLDKSIGEKKD